MTHSCHGFNSLDPSLKQFSICEVSHWLAYPPYNLSSLRNVILTRRHRLVAHAQFLGGVSQELRVESDCVCFSEMSLPGLFFMEFRSLTFKLFSRFCVFTFRSYSFVPLTVFMGILPCDFNLAAKA